MNHSRRRHGARFIVTAIAIATASAFVVEPAFATATNADVARWQRFRHSFGLRDDESFTRLVGGRAEAHAPDVSIEYGTPLTTAEVDELRARDARGREQATAIRGYLRRQPRDLSAGMYLDHRANGTMVVLVTRDRDRVENDVRTLGVHAEMISVARVDYSEAYLRQIQDAITTGNYRANGVLVVASTLRVRENLVEVRVESDPKTASDVLAIDFPRPAVRVVQGQPAERHGTYLKNSPPFRGGQAIGQASVSQCSIGFIAQVSDLYYYALTAGHCGNVGSVWYQPCCAGTGAGVGVMDYNPYIGGTSRTDAARIPISSTRKSDDITRTMPGGGIYYYDILWWEGQGADYVGETDCQAGFVTNWDCGQITATSFDYYDEGVGRWFVYLRKSDVQSAEGDSGGPHFHVPIAHGIHLGKDLNYIEDPSDDEAVYSHIYDVLYDLNLSGLA